MKNDLLIFVHKSESWYLYYTIKQARYFHPNARIVLITDCPQKNLRGYAEIHDIYQYWEGARTMEDIYDHNSPFTREYEITNFQRWFVVRDFLRRNPSDRAIYVDSDVLVCDELFEDFGRLNGADLGIVGFQGPFTMLIPSQEVIARFCDFITYLYTDENERRSLTEQYNEWRKITEDISVTDMHALHTFISAKGLTSLDLAKPYNGYAYDNIVLNSDGFEVRDGFKDIQWFKGKPYVKELGTGRQVRLKTIHCQGNGKSLILRLFAAKDLAFYRDRVFLKFAKLAAR
jgi:hypothetical protein